MKPPNNNNFLTQSSEKHYQPPTTIRNQSESESSDFSSSQKVDHLSTSAERPKSGIEPKKHLSKPNVQRVEFSDIQSQLQSKSLLYKKLALKGKSSYCNLHVA